MSKNRYPLELKLEVIKYYLSNQGGQKKTAKHFGMNRITIRNWIRIYQTYGLEGFDQKGRKKKVSYPEQFKLNVLKYKQKHNITAQATADKFNIPSSKLISLWEEMIETISMEEISTKEKISNYQSMITYTNVTKALNALTTQELMKELMHLRAENAYLKKLKALILKKS